MLVGVDWEAVRGSLPPGEMLRFRGDFAERVWRTRDAVEFAVTFGIPYSRGLFRMSAEVAERDAASADMEFVADIDSMPTVTPVGELQPLGLLFHAMLYVRPADGTIWVSDPDAEVEFELIHRDLSSLAYLVYKVEVERPGPEEDPTPYDWAEVEEIIQEDMNRWDATPFDDATRFWTTFLQSYPMM
ncbi:SUKH-4 family immunity protein [Nocardia sp. CDC153]|uniref:SUKH-4 family immunity protein n=1 Tax=Nocardia sp. CDC153 TaxID=3112167 RepID=UPI002DBE1CF0|nr:SUKH-4 family immunity protein [Nocardia sp. CDC153]MEC3955891.1 SUKH-4 family immunity protein [Nocardia sp. CDC153]